MTRVALIVVFVGAAVATPARAQESTEATASTEAARPCAEGRVREAGRCCWPAQQFVADVGRCVGAPACPEGLVEHGEQCVAPSLAISVTSGTVVPEPASASTATPQPTSRRYETSRSRTSRSFAESVEGWREVTDDVYAPRARAAMTQGEDEGLIIAALAVFDTGWVLGWLGTMLDEIVLACSDFSTFPARRFSCGGAAWSLVPFGGALGSGLTTPSGASHSSGFGIGFGIASVILQGIGGIMAIIAFVNETNELGYQPMHSGTGLSASLLPGAQGADGGLTFELAF